MNTVSQFDDLLEVVRSRRSLPRPTERRRIREDAGVSLRAVGDALGVSHAAVASWERGATPRKQGSQYAELLRELEAVTQGNVL
jgi:DNA-binding transcriptional regulator YiaG